MEEQVLTVPHNLNIYIKTFVTV